MSRARWAATLGGDLRWYSSSSAPGQQRAEAVAGPSCTFPELDVKGAARALLHLFTG